MKIILKGIQKKFGDDFEIRNLNLTIESNEFTTLLGPSGCGKTTILRMVAGLEKPDQGEIWFDDVCVFSDKANIYVTPEKRNLGFVFQDFALWPHMTIFQNVAFSLNARKDKKDVRERVMRALESVQLEKMAERYPHQLSGGQQQRVAFARAIAGNPNGILFDEPLSALDAILREEMRAEIKERTRQLGITSVFVTHDQLEAMSMSDKIVVMNRGKIEQIGEPEVIYNLPKTKFVATFIGKSNWLGEEEMFRPEGVELVKRDGLKEYVVRVEDVQFVGQAYQVKVRSANREWMIVTPKKLQLHSEVPIYVDESNITKVTA